MIVWSPGEEPREVPDPEPEAQVPDGTIITYLLCAMFLVFVVVMIAVLLWAPE